MINKKAAVALEIWLLVTAIVSFSYILNEASPDTEYAEVSYYGENAWVILEKIGNFLFNDLESASAISAEDLEIYYCPIAKDGKKCMEFIKSECDSKCNVACVSGKGINECTRGTCFNSGNGICSKNSPKGECESKKMEWFNEPKGNIPQCMRGCCVINGEGTFITEQECSYRSEKLGINKDFRSEILGQPACEALVELKDEGACVFEKQPLNDCVFTTKENCQTRRGEFYSKTLCSNPGLKTECKPQARNSCIEGKDEVYWVDSCGNRENVYDFSKKAELKEKGKAALENERCILGNPKDPGFSERQKTCGNCNAILGTICGKKTPKESLVESSAEYVCRDQSCTDSGGTKRANGESWCRYQGSTGEDKNRGTDTPGSNHFLERCENGEIVTNACGNYREEVCAESRIQTESGTSFSNAQCITNLGALCLDYNRLDSEKRTSECQKNPHCFIKKIDVAEKFSFDMCVPRYKLGADRDNSEYNEAQCGMLNSIQCKYIKIKKLGGKKEINKECMTEKFTQQMNDLCMSLGECGAQANYQGDLTENYRVSNAPGLSHDYLSGIIKYHEEKLFKDKPAPEISFEDYFKIVGVPSDLGNAQLTPGSAEAMLKQGSMIAGATGSIAMMVAYKGVAGTIAATSNAVVVNEISTVATATATKSSIFSTVAPYAGALAGAAVGFALTSFLLDITGVGRGLPPAITYYLMGAAAVAGGIVGLQAVSAGGLGAVSFSGPALAAAAAWALVGLVIIIVVIVVLMALGIGKVKKMDVTFTCKPWQPPLGGKNCDKCGKDGFPCTKSACESLGMTCELINEEIGSPECVNIAPNDVNPPVLKPELITPDSYKFTQEEFGVKVESIATGCIEETYTPVFLKLTASEPARCRMTSDPKEGWDEMEYLGERSAFLRNHTALITIPSLESLGIPGYDYTAKADLKINIFCEDKSGNRNTRAYTLNFCVKQGNDTSPLRIAGREPVFNEIAIDKKEMNISVFTNEPAECKWELSDKEYDSMTHEMECANELEDYTLKGFECKSTFLTNKEENLFYVRCKDQPWHAIVNESLRNTMAESYVFNLTKVKEPLKAEVINPSGGKIIEAESEPVSVKVEVRTSGGLNGQAECFYKYRDSTTRFTETFSDMHTSIFDYLMEGNIEIPIICKDSLDNIAESKATFNIKLDTTPPAVTRVYSRSGNLNVITEKSGRCAYSNNPEKACGFSYEKGAEMSGEGLVHTVSLQKEKTYYIKCKNKFNKTAGSCSIIARGGSI